MWGIIVHCMMDTMYGGSSMMIHHKAYGSALRTLIPHTAAEETPGTPKGRAEPQQRWACTHP